VPATSADFRNDTAKVLKGVVRAEKLEAPSAYIDEVLARCKRKYLLKKYNLPVDTTFKDGEEFLEIMARKMGTLILYILNINIL
jgi:nuclear GTP-binding protein